MKKITLIFLLTIFLSSTSFAADIVGKIVRSKDSVLINGKYYDKNKSSKTISLGDEIMVCCGGALIVHFEKNANIDEIVRSPKVLKFKITSPDPKLKNNIKRYAAYTTLAAASRGGIFEPPLYPPHGATAFLEEEITLQWNKPGKMFYLIDSNKKIVFKQELDNAKEFTFTPSNRLKIKEGKYYWKIDNSDRVEINFIK